MNIYNKNKKYEDLKNYLYFTKNAIINNSKILNIKIKENQLKNLEQYGINKIFYINDLKNDFDELFCLSQNQISLFEEKGININILDKKQIHQFNNDKISLDDALKQFKYERKFK